MSGLSEKPLKIGVVGCGAAMELRHLPALVRRNDVQIAALVDSNQTRARKLAEDFSVPRVLTNHQGFSIWRSTQLSSRFPTISMLL